MIEIEMPDDDAIERMAKAIHENYRAAREGLEPPDHPAMRTWDELSPDLRGQNRDQARDNIVKLASVDLRAGPVDSDEAGVGATINDDDMEELARQEHDRWATQKEQQGYRYGKERVNEGPDKRHPDLKAWGDLAEDVKDKDRAPVRDMIDVLAAAGLTTVRVES